MRAGSVNSGPVEQFRQVRWTLAGINHRTLGGERFGHGPKIEYEWRRY
jgi:hypothetical protein